MEALKPLFGILRTLVPILYCGGLFYYFYDQAGSIEQAKEMGLTPALLGLGAIGLLFLIWLVIKLLWILGVARSTRAFRRSFPGAPADNFDADAVVARHLAQRSRDPGTPSPPLPPPPSQPTRRRSFGKRR